MSLFNKGNTAGNPISQRNVLENKYANARHNILLVVALTVINIVLLVTNSNTYFLFSAYIPYLLVDLGMLLCGMYPTEMYIEDMAGMEFLSKSFLITTVGIAAVILILYILSWVFSKKPRVGWLIFALVFFGIDTLAMIFLNGVVLESVIDYVIHAWVIISLINGIIAYFKLKKLPEESDETDLEESPVLENAELAPVAQDESSAIETSEETAE